MFDVLWTILLGIVGGVISSVIVSRVFMIQGEYQQQVKFIENIIRKLGMIAGYLSACRAVFEVSYDQDMRIENEMKEKGYKCETEYYVANKDKDWISTSEILKTFKSYLLLGDIREYLYDVESVKELNFSTINEFRKEEQKLFDKFENCKSVSGKQLISLVLKDKLMVVLYVIVGVLVISTCLAFAFGW